MEAFIIKHNPVERTGGMLVEHPSYASLSVGALPVFYGSFKGSAEEDDNVHS